MNKPIISLQTRLNTLRKTEERCNHVVKVVISAEGDNEKQLKDGSISSHTLTQACCETYQSRTGTRCVVLQHGSRQELLKEYPEREFGTECQESFRTLSILHFCFILPKRGVQRR